MKRSTPPDYPLPGAIGEDQNGDLRFATYGYDGKVTWKLLPRWRWLLRRRIYRELERDNYSYSTVYFLDLA